MTIKDVSAFLLAHDNYLIITHRRPDGDSLGSASALACGLRAKGKTVYVYNNPETTSRYLAYVEPFFAPSDFLPECILTVDVASENLFPIGAESLLGQVDLSIDHHPSNTYYAKNTYADGSKAACGEIIYDLLMDINGSVSTEIAAALYVAISTDTGCFQFGNTNENTFRVASCLATTGLNFQEINHRLFRTKTRGRFELEATVMNEMRFYYGGRVAMTAITRALMKSTGCTEDDMDDIAAIPGAVDGVLCGITLRELSSETNCKISVRSGHEFNSNEFCRKFGGGGHAMAAGASFDGIGIEELREKLLDELDKTFLSEGIAR